MAFLVDQMMERGRKWTKSGHTASCHLATDIADQRGLAELCEFAALLELNDKWLHWGGAGRRLPHFDLTVGKRSLALSMGAREIDMRTLLVLCRWQPETPGLPNLLIPGGITK